MDISSWKTTLQAILLNERFQGALFGITVSLLTFFSKKYADQRRLKKKYGQQRSDTIRFLENLEKFYGNNINLDDYLNEIGEYRFKKITKALSVLQILTVTYTQGGSVINWQRGASSTGEDIKIMVREVIQGDFDQYFDA